MRVRIARSRVVALGRQPQPGPLMAPWASRADLTRLAPSLARLGWLKLNALPMAPAAQEVERSEEGHWR